jgi:von Willebrand factor type A domain/Aerotolerance regulator N-terminal
VGFFNPASLLLGLSLLVLVAIYLRSRARPTINVSSLMLFEEVPAPVAKSRILRVDALFWLEALALFAMTLAAAGLYVFGQRPRGPHQLHVLVFDLGAGMQARSGRPTRLDEARSEARKLISATPSGDQFSIIGYALEARTLFAPSSAREELLSALDKLQPMAVAARPAALRAALLDARGAATIDIFADRQPAKEVVSEARPEGRVEVHQVGAPADNVAIVALDPGVPRVGAGHCVLRNFSNRPAECELELDNNGRQIARSPLFIEPRAQTIVSFPPLTEGGLLHARLIAHDALAADNQRYALAPSIAQAKVLVLSPDVDARDDLARIVLAINPNYVVTALDSGRYPSSSAAAQHFALAVLHDCSDAGVQASARLFIFPEPLLAGSKRALVPVTGSVTVAELESRQDTGPLATPALLGPSRILSLPGWMDSLARGAPLGGHDSLPIAAIGHSSDGEVGVISFDIRNHLLLDPDRLDALVLTVDILKRLVAPENIKVVSTGTFVAVTTFGDTTLTSPDGSTTTLQPDRWGRVRFRPLQVGRYAVRGGHREIAVYANYYDAAESDLTSSAPPRAVRRPLGFAASAHSENYPQPAGFPLILAAILLVLGESTLIAYRAIRWSARHA